LGRASGDDLRMELEEHDMMLGTLPPTDRHQNPEKNFAPTRSSERRGETLARVL
jgi:hypothetical protein